MSNMTRNIKPHLVDEAIEFIKTNGLDVKYVIRGASSRLRHIKITTANRNHLDTLLAFCMLIGLTSQESITSTQEQWAWLIYKNISPTG